eukprot:m.310805 g.310805  ORF g.310805 m.310805 type:complete len:145 (+) comp55067_c0_seq1:54-488(+)
MNDPSILRGLERARFNREKAQTTTFFRRNRRQTVKGYGSYTCKCSHNWSSYSSWITIDIIRAEVVKKFKQNCQQCECEVKPSFEEKELTRMAEFAIRRMRKKDGSSVQKEKIPEEQLKAPHDSTRCEKCKKKGRPCCPTQLRRL